MLVFALVDMSDPDRELKNKDSVTIWLGPLLISTVVALFRTDLMYSYSVALQPY